MVAVPPLATVAGPLTVELVGLATGFWKVTLAGGLNVTLSVVSTAVRLTSSATVSVTVKVVCPLLFVRAGDGPLTVVVDDEGVRLTALPATGSPPVAKRVTVTVDLSTPSAVGVAGDGTTVERVGLGVVAAGGAEPSPAGLPVSPATGAMKNGWDHTWFWVKSLESSPM
ncbi:MAG TPA: hypothetical protein VN886_20415 [Acidimicrobiales bacterium]|nr:hypothetical protein [Acidimicrobiales bacterium]